MVEQSLGFGALFMQIKYIADLRHWAWLRRGYWRYKNLIDWLIAEDNYFAAEGVTRYK